MGDTAEPERLLLVDDNINALRALQYVFEREGFRVDCAASGPVALDLLRKARFDAVISDVMMPGMDGIELLGQVHAQHPDLPVLMLSAHGTIERAVEAVRRGAFDFAQKPWKPAEICAKVRRAMEKLPPPTPVVQDALATEQPERVGEALIGTSAVMRRTVAQIETVAKKVISVVIYGESGTGKELAARALHMLSPRRDRPFVAINCATIPETLLENELFGHVRGAYTGATNTHKGLFEEAHTGTIFLDEIGDISPSIQAKLLRVLQEQEFKKVGGTKDVRVDVRVVTATNKDLREAVAAGRFREDLFYRINVIPIQMPALRERLDDIPLLAQHFRVLFNQELHLNVKGFTDEALVRMMSFDWPGNVRELRNRIKMAVVMAKDSRITAEDLGFQDTGEIQALPNFNEARESFEKEYVTRVLKLCGGNVKKAAKLAGRDRSTFYDLLNKHELCPDEFREVC